MSVELFRKTSLGNSLEFYKSMQSIGKLGDESCNKKYDAIYGALVAAFNDDPGVGIQQWYYKKLQDQCKAFMREFKGKLVRHDAWIIKQLMTACKRNVPPVKSTTKSKTKKRK
jgi:hypothetical protein